MTANTQLEIEKLIKEYNTELAEILKKEFRIVEEAYIKKLDIYFKTGKKVKWHDGMYMTAYVFKHLLKEIYIIVSLWEASMDYKEVHERKSTRSMHINVFFNEFVDKTTFKKYIKYDGLRYELDTKEQYESKLKIYKETLLKKIENVKDIQNLQEIVWKIQQLLEFNELSEEEKKIFEQKLKQAYEKLKNN